MSKTAKRLLTLWQAATGNQFATTQVERLRTMLIQGAASLKVSEDEGALVS